QPALNELEDRHRGERLGHRRHAEGRVDGVGHPPPSRRHPERTGVHRLPPPRDPDRTGESLILGGGGHHLVQAARIESARRRDRHRRHLTVELPHRTVTIVQHHRRTAAVTPAPGPPAPAREGNDAAPADGILLRLPVPSTCPPPSPGTAAGCTSSTASWTIRPGSRRTPCRRSTIRPAGRRPAGAAAGTRPDLSVGARPATGRAPTGTAPRPPGAGLRVGMRVEALRRLVQEGGDRADAAVTVEGEDVGARGELLTADVEPPQQPGVTVVDLRLPARPE